MSHHCPTDSSQNDSIQESSDLDSALQEIATMRTERDELATAVAELRAAFVTIREELVASKGQAAAAQETADRLQQVVQTLEQRDAELKSAQTANSELQSTISELQQQMSTLTEQFENERETLRNEALQTASESREEELLEQIQQLRDELARSNDRTIEPSEMSIPENQEADVAQGTESEAESAPEPEALQPETDVASDFVAENDSQPELTETPTDHVSADDAGHAMSQAECVEAPADAVENSVSTELSQDDSPSEVEQLNQEMAEAPQGSSDSVDAEQNSDTEVTEGPENDNTVAAEVTAPSTEHITDYISELFGVTAQAPDTQTNATDEETAAHYPEESSTPPEPPPVPDMFSLAADVLSAAASTQDAADPPTPATDDANEDIAPATSVNEEPAQPSVRSEIAELFGLTSSAFQEKPAEEKKVMAAAELMTAVDDYSQETSAAVSMSFSEAEKVLLRPNSQLVAESESIQEEADEEDHDDFVSQYMEQLLSRNRQSAGESLPEELTRPGSSGRSKPKAKDAPKPKTGASASFIDQYMSGAYDGAEQPAATGADASATDTATPPPVAAPRKKVDVEVLRQSMNSFREVSTRSTENALATHARRQQRGGIAARITILAALSLVCLLVLSASLTNAIPFGLLTWLSMIAVAVSGGELLLKLKTIQSQIQQSSLKLNTNPLGAPPAADNPPNVEAGPTSEPHAVTQNQE